MTPRQLVDTWVAALNRAGGRIRFQRGYWDKLSFLRMHGLPLPQD